jgi:hypothetical protein
MLAVQLAAQAAPAELPTPEAAAAPDWRFVGLPSRPATRIERVELDGEAALRVETAAGYGQWLHEFKPMAAQAQPIEWQWRLDQRNDAADLRTRAGDDASLRVCAMFALPDAQVPFEERLLLRIARARSAEPLPAATLCYVWDAHLSAGTVLPNAYSGRVRYLVVEDGSSPLGRWRTQRRDLGADFLRVFGDESSVVPPLAALAIGADGDNTGRASLGYLRGLRWLR